MTLAAQNIEWDEVQIDFAAMKTDANAYPCGQCPRYVDDSVDMVQSNAIVRHLGRKHNISGADLKEQAEVEMIIEAVESIKSKYLTLIYVDQLSDEAKEAYWKTHIDASTVNERNSGAHFTYVDRLVQRLSGAGPFALGSSLSIADIVVFDVTDMHMRIWGDEFKVAYPGLAKLHESVAAVPGVAAYLASDRRFPKQNGNSLG